MKTSLNFKLLGLLALFVLLSACRGAPSERTQIQPIQNMYWQQKFKAFEPNDFFEDRRAMRAPVEGTIPRGFLENDAQIFMGVNMDGSYVETIPIELDLELLQRGQRVYDIYCTPCHGLSGYGDGIVIGRGYVPPPSFHEERVLSMPDGEIHSAIYNGAGSMPSYRHAVGVAEDRWAVVAYIRALQVSQGATDQDLEELGLDRASLQTSDDMYQDMASN